MVEGPSPSLAWLESSAPVTMHPQAQRPGRGLRRQSALPNCTFTFRLINVYVMNKVFEGYPVKRNRLQDPAYHQYEPCCLAA